MATLKYDKLSDELQERIQNDIANNKRPDFSCRNDQAIRRIQNKDIGNIWRPAYSRDIDKIMHSAYYNRYADKTQVFSFYKNDDITRRALHVQLVSRIARNIGQVLGLNLELIEAIALGHDIGHTPFGHAGERYLNELYHGNTGRYFNHNVHSVRVLDGIIPYNISLQTLDGILCHNGEDELAEYCPVKQKDFAAFDEMVERAYIDKESINRLISFTLEGCLVRICDMIAYIGKDRQDSAKAKLIKSDGVFRNSKIGKLNAEILTNLSVNIIENSYGKNCIKLDEEYFKELKACKAENCQLIYKNEAICAKYDKNIKPMFIEVYNKLFTDLKANNQNSPIFKHHIEFIENIVKNYKGPTTYREQEPNQIVVDYIASMTDDYFIDLYGELFPNGKYEIKYESYFEDLRM